MKTQKPATGLIRNEAGAFQGYTLYAPLFSKSTYLIDMQGRVVNQWLSDYEPGQSAYLLENGHLLRCANPGPETNRTFHGGGSGGKVQEFTWDGDLVWEFTYSSDEYMLHHDIEQLPSGNILMIAWEKITPQAAAAAGRNPDKLGEEGLWSEKIIEVKPTGKTSGEIVWEWHVWDHLIQNRERSRNNYGQVAEHAGRIDINPFDWTEQLTGEERERLEALGYMAPAKRRGKGEMNPDWLHINSVAYDPNSDRIVLSVLGFNEIWVIDHGISTEEAAGSKGDLLFRWGNPRAHGAGETGDQQLFAQHDAHFIAEGLPGAGHLLIFNNGRGRPGGNFSSVEEIDAGGKPVWFYSAPDKETFFSTHISGAQRLGNGNTLICSGANGRFFEVTAEGRVVWEYVNPIVGKKRPPPGMGRPDRRGPPGDEDRRQRNRPGPRGGPPGKDEPQNCVFRAYRYGTDYPAFQGRDLTPEEAVIAPPGSQNPEKKEPTNENLMVLNRVQFTKVVPGNARLEKLAGGMGFIEGPVWVPEGGYLLFSDIPGDEIKKWRLGELSTFRKPSHNTNGNLLDPQGRLLSCEHGSRSVTRTLDNGEVETLVERFEGKKLNSPNDLAVRSDGCLWFSDPTYGLKKRSKELEHNHVFFINPETGDLRSVANDFDMPNGLCLSPDEKKLYIADSGKPAHIRVFEVNADGSLSNGKVFCKISPGAPDGIRCDEEGRVFSSAGDGVHLFLPTGELVGKILVPERPTNLCFGGKEKNTLFITARTSLYAIPLKGR